MTAPEGMVWVPGGEFDMGSEEPMFEDARPVHRVAVDGFWMDATEVTNAQFQRFVEATGYVTVAERVPRAEDLPRCVARDAVRARWVPPPPTAVRLDNHFQWWNYVKGASWRHPEGRRARSRTAWTIPWSIAFEDAQAYARWAGKRLPTEAEWSSPARAGLPKKKYLGMSSPKASSWPTPSRDTSRPEHCRGRIRVHQSGEGLPANAFGPRDGGERSGVVSDWYRADYYGRLAAARGTSRSPPGPSDSFDPSEPGVAKRVQKGGSFLCTDQYCARYMPGGRGKGAPDTGTNHLGFRLVKG
jgi:formylglycine-generating enzyme required for sulfatase activity